MRRHLEALLARKVGDDQRRALRDHATDHVVGPVREGNAVGLRGVQAAVAGHAQLEPVGCEQEHRHRVDFERLGSDRGQALQQLVGIERVHCDAAELDHELVVACALQCALDARVGTDAAHRGHHIVHRRVAAAHAQRAERDLDHHLAAVGAPGHQVQVGAHRACLGGVRVAAAVGGMARRHVVGHQAVHRNPLEGVDGVAEHVGGGLVGKHDQPPAVDQQHAVGVGVEQAAKDPRVVGV